MSAKEKDQFFTKPSIVDHCLSVVSQFFDLQSYDTVIEPSVGSGSFYNKLPDNKVGIDMYTTLAGCVQSDYLEWHPDLLSFHKMITVGNPPFGGTGRSSGSLATEFINKSLKYGPVCFILPISFNRPQMQSRIDKMASLIHSENLPTNAFTLEDKDYSVPCVFQIWVPWKDDNDIRVNKWPSKHEDYVLYGHRGNFESVPDDYDFALRVWGEGSSDFRIGTTLTKSEYENRENKLGDFSVYFVQSKHKDIFDKIKYEDIKTIYGGSPRLTATAVYYLYEKAKARAKE